MAGLWWTFDDAFVHLIGILACQRDFSPLVVYCCHDLILDCECEGVGYSWVTCGGYSQLIPDSYLAPKCLG